MVRLRSSLLFIDIKSEALVIIILSSFSCLYSLILRPGPALLVTVTVLSLR